jgi:hypothetical protein
VAEQFVGELRRDAEAAGGVFAVGDGQVDIVGGDDVAQVAGDKAPPDRGEDVTNEQESCGQKDVFSKERTTKPS